MLGSVEKKVGIFFIVGLIFLLFLTILVGKIKPFRKGILYYINFNYVAGLRVGDEVRLAGMKVGEVTDLKFSGSKITVTIWVKKGTPIKQDSQFTITSVSIMGGKLVSITLGSPDSPLMKSGSVVKGIDPPRVEELITEATEIGEEVKETLKKFQNIASKLSGWVEENRENIGKSITQFNETFVEVQELTHSIRELVNQINQGEGTLGKLIKEKDTYEKLVNIIREGEEASRDIKELSKKANSTFDRWEKEISPSLKELREILEKINKGEGTVGKLIASEEMYKEVKETLKSTKKVSAGAKDMIEQIKQVRTFIGYEGGTGFDKKGAVHTGYLRIEPRPGKYYLIGGGTEMEEEIPLFRAEIGKEIRKKVALHGGWIETGGGLGITFNPRENLKILTEGFYRKDVEPFYFRSRIYYRMRKNMWVFIGGENLLDESYLMVGIKVEFEDEDIKYMIGALSVAR
ncbi:MCE family protein [Candidatus Calescamantes bacterium]|nr:MCE family protein [Candidatus Calescamantes bacterium]